MRTKMVNGEVVELSAEENAARDLAEEAWADSAFGRSIMQLRQQRDQILSQTDWRALSDQDMSQEWADYRQQLRDITQDLETVEDVDGVAWPTQPE